MKGVKDEEKQMDHPLFPRFHVDDADKGGPRAPPRNKMAICEQYKHNLSTQNVRHGTGSMNLPPLPSSNGCSTYVQQSTASNAGNLKHKALPPFSNLPGSSHSVDISHSYYSHGVNLNISLKKSEPRISGNTNDQDPQISGNSRRINDYATPNYCKLQLCLDKEGYATFSSFTSEKLHNIQFYQPDEAMSCYQLGKDQQNRTVKINKFSQNIDDQEEKKPELSVVEKTSVDAASTSFDGNNVSKGTGDLRVVCNSSRFSYAQPFQERNLQESMAETIMRKRHAPEIDDLTCSLSRSGDNHGTQNIDRIRACFEDKDYEAIHVGSTGKKQETSGTSKEDSLHGLPLNSADAVGVIDQRLFWEARQTIVHQQKIFAVQIFELHRLVKVQKLIAGSPEVIYESNLNLKNPSIMFPPMNKLLFVTPLDPSPIVAKPRVEAKKSNPDNGKLLPPLNPAAKRHFTQPSAPNTPSTSASTPTDCKLTSWCFYPPTRYQWLIPVRSPSEGLIYKPYTEPCPPAVGIMTSAYENCAPISLNTVSGTAYGVPAMTHHGNGRFSGVPLGQSYFQHMPTSTGGSNVEIKQAIPVDEPHSDSCWSSQQSGVLYDGGEKLHGSEGSRTNSPKERLEGEVLPLFPTTPSVQDTKDSNNEPRIQVIRVVPYNPKSAPESAARIFQSIQEERTKLE